MRLFYVTILHTQRVINVYFDELILKRPWGEKVRKHPAFFEAATLLKKHCDSELIYFFILSLAL